MFYTTYLTIGQMKYLNLFDEIPYKFVKELNDDTDVVDVDIEDMSGDGYPSNRCKHKFTFSLRTNVSGGSLPLWSDREYIVVQEYYASSRYALYMSNLLREYDIDFDDEEYENASTIQAMVRGVNTRKRLRNIPKVQALYRGYNQRWKVPCFTWGE